MDGPKQRLRGGDPDTWLAQKSKVHICARVRVEGGSLDRVPHMSILEETLVVQALSVLLQAHYDISPWQYVAWHPGGALGRLRDGE